MNLTYFCNISRLLIRNLNVLKLQNEAPARSIYAYKIKLPAPMTYYGTNNKTLHRNANGGGEHEHDGNGQGRQSDNNQREKWRRRLIGVFGATTAVSSAFSFNFFGRNSDSDESPEDRLINTIKRSILCIQSDQYDKAEQMLHLALRMAQDLQSHEGITYVYDLMANLAMDREQYKKAENLFADVMKRLLADGYSESSPQILHISSKLAHMAQLQGELEKALLGFSWTLKRIEENLRRVPEDKEVKELLGLTKNWFGQLQMKLGKYGDAKKLFREAFDCLTDIYGRANEEAITILNNLSIACVDLDEFDEAKRYLNEALALVHELDDTSQEGVLQANLGLIFLREGLVSQAKDACSLAYRIGKKNNNMDAVEQAEYCLNEIKSSIK